MARWRVGVDSGGTFTDVCLFDEEDGRVEVWKVSSTPDDPSRGIAQGVEEGMRRVAPDAAQPGALASYFGHGTTVATNALIQHRGVRTGLVTTDGFRDLLEIGRQKRPDLYDMQADKPPTLVPRDLRQEVPERVRHDGRIDLPLDEDRMRAAARALKAAGVQAIAVSFLYGFIRPEHERRAVEILREEMPEVFISAGHEIAPEFREFERLSTVVLNAYLGPVMRRYIERLTPRLQALGMTATPHLTQSNGGVIGFHTAAEMPVRAVLSGPSTGVVGAQAIGALSGFPDLITFDMGGTSTDVALIEGGRPMMAMAAEVHGHALKTPMLDIHTVGAGGGSIARVDAGGHLKVGPASAGADPGPVCYGLGNAEPTVTDANVVLGAHQPRTGPSAAALSRLDVDAAKAAIAQHVGDPLGLETMAAAEAIVRVANARMAGAIRLVSIERGHDPQKFVALPFGGGGALHVGALIKEVGLQAALVPRFPGVTSALGCVIADVRHDQVRTLNLSLGGIDAAALDRRMVEEAAQARGIVEAAGLPVHRIEIRFELDMHYAGQTHTVGVPLPLHVIDGSTGVSEAVIRTAFETAYQAAFSRLLPGLPIRIVSLRTAAIGLRPDFDLAALAPPADATLKTAARTPRQVWFDGAWHSASVWSRLDLPEGARVHGPAILEQPDATVVVDPDLVARVDRFGNLIIELE